MCIPHAPSGPNFSSILLYDELFSSLGPILRKVYQMVPKWHWHVQGQNHFALLWAVFELQPNFDKNTPNHLNILRSTHISAYTHESQIFVSFALRWYTSFELRTSFEKCLLNDFKMTSSKSKAPTYMHITYPLMSEFFSASLYEEPFPRYNSILRSVLNDPKMTDILRSKVPICTLHMLLMPKVLSFWEIDIF